MSISTVLVYEDGVFRPLQPLQLPEHRVFRATLAPATEDEREMTNDQLDALNAELGFDVRDEEIVQTKVRERRRVLKEWLAAYESTSVDNVHDVSVCHDHYLYNEFIGNRKCGIVDSKDSGDFHEEE